MENNQAPRTDGVERGMGYLVVRVSTAGGAVPIENATVKVWNTPNIPSDEPAATDVRLILNSDRDGNSPRVPLPTPPRAVAYTPGATPYALYNIDVAADGYYPQNFVNVPLYDTITSIQNAYLIPLPEGSIADGREPLENNVDERVNPML